MAIILPVQTIKNRATTLDWAAKVLPPLIVAIVVLTLWQFEVIHAILNIKTFQLPLPSQIIAAAGKRSRDLWIGINYTLLEVLLGLAIGSAVGLLMALLFVWFDFARRGLMPIAVATNAIPIIAFVPIMSRWFGFDQPTRIAVVTMMTFGPMVVSAYKGLTSLDANSADLMHTYAASRVQVFLKLRLPSSLPYLFAALKVGTTVATIGAVVAEFFNSAGGIGKLVANNIQSGDFALAWCGVIIVTLMGLALYLLVGLAERLLVPWQSAYRAQPNN